MYTMKPIKNQDALTKYAHVLNAMTIKNIRNISEIHKVLCGILRSVNPSSDPINFKFMASPPAELIKKTDEYISKHPVMGFLIIKND